MPFDTTLSPGDTYIPFGSPMNTDPVEHISNTMQKLQTGSFETQFDVEAHHQRLLRTGPYKDAADRQAIWDRLVQERLNPSAPTNHEEIVLMANPEAQNQMDQLMHGARTAPQSPAPVAGMHQTEPLQGIGTHDGRSDTQRATLRRQLEQQDQARMQQEQDALKAANRKKLGLP